MKTREEGTFFEDRPWRHAFLSFAKGPGVQGTQTEGNEREWKRVYGNFVRLILGRWLPGEPVEAAETLRQKTGLNPPTQGGRTHSPRSPSCAAKDFLSRGTLEGW